MLHALFTVYISASGYEVLHASYVVNIGMPTFQILPLWFSFMSPNHALTVTSNLPIFNGSIDEG